MWKYPAIAVAILVVALDVAVGSAGAGAEARSTAPRAPVAIGYPYASACPAAGIAKRVDRWGMFECNCTSYVAWALQRNGQRIDWFIPGAMDAWNWPNVARRSGLRVVASPAVGEVAVWPKLARPFGHVGYVTAVERGRFDVAEYNFPFPAGQAQFEYDTRIDVSARGAVFIVVPGTHE